jgi:CBS domain-containing protein
VRTAKEAYEMPNQIVGSIARIPVPSASPSTPVTKIASIMTRQNIGAVIISRDFEVLGIVTERDIVERIALAKKDLHYTVAQDIMTTPVFTIDYNRTLNEALTIMKQNNIRRLVVVKDASIFGLLTERRALLAHFNELSKQ